ncbi:MAG: hypothetical protein KTR26_10790, partial [Flammeovirgaceae bacterium]|nr:hypothetical protein [Flammeovirgaceae bacterium]
MKNNNIYIDQNAVTILTEVEEGSKDDLCNLLTKMGSDEKGGGIVDFEKISTLHFLRWFLIGNEDVPNTKEGDFENDKLPVTLAFTSNYDGDLDAHLKEILEVAREGIIKVYKNCKGFPKPAAPSDSEIITYLKANTKKNQLFWPAIRGGTVEQLKGESLLRSAIQGFLDSLVQEEKIECKSPKEIKELIVEFVGKDDSLSWALTPRAKPSFSWKFKYYGALVLNLVVFLFPLLILLGICFLLSYIFNKKDNKNRKDISRSQDFDALLKNEDRIFMNQLTVYGALKKPYWFRRTQLRLGLWLFSLNGKYRSNKGKLSGMETIHFARWALFNKNRNVMFLSNYDGAWEIYLSEFIDRSAAAMNL